MLALGMLAIGVATALGRNYCGRFTKAHALRAAHKLRVNWSKVRFTPADLAHGMNVEREHRNITGCSPTMSAKIALAHFRERPDYYRRLSRYVEVGSLNGSGLGTIPPEPHLEFTDQWKKWARITFAAGTPVKLIGPVGRPDATTTTNLLLDPEGAGYDEYIHDIEAGMRGVTTGRFAWERSVSVKIVDARDKWGSRRTDAIGRTVLVRAGYLEPLADNWVQKRKP